MTNSEYERASVEAAIGRAKLAAVDAKITEAEQAMVYLLHQRREIVNQYDLNKYKDGISLDAEEYMTSCRTK